MSAKYKPPSMGYPGGKSKIAKKIIAQMPPHSVYVEPFAGMASVFFRKPRAEKNILNDKNKVLMDFFREVKKKGKVCCNIKDDKATWDRIKAKEDKSICDYLFLNRTSYGSKSIFEQGKATYAQRKRKINTNRCMDGSTLNGAVLLSQDFRTVVPKYDSSKTLFYVDPPYVQANKKECLYGKGYCQVTPEEVAKTLHGIKGKALVSYDDHPEVRKAFKGWKISKITLPYSLAKIGGTDKIKGKTEELLIKNY